MGMFIFCVLSSRLMHGLVSFNNLYTMYIFSWTSLNQGGVVDTLGAGDTFNAAVLGRVKNRLMDCFGKGWLTVKSFLSYTRSESSITYSPPRTKKLHLENVEIGSLFSMNVATYYSNITPFLYWILKFFRNAPKILVPHPGPRMFSSWFASWCSRWSWL